MADLQWQGLIANHSSYNIWKMLWTLRTSVLTKSINLENSHDCIKIVSFVLYKTMLMLSYFARLDWLPLLKHSHIWLYLPNVTLPFIWAMDWHWEHPSLWHSEAGYVSWYWVDTSSIGAVICLYPPSSPWSHLNCFKLIIYLVMKI